MVASADADVFLPQNGGQIMGMNAIQGKRNDARFVRSLSVKLNAR